MQLASVMLEVVVVYEKPGHGNVAKKEDVVENKGLYICILIHIWHICVYTCIYVWSSYIYMYIYNYRRYSINHREYVQSYTYTVSELTNSDNAINNTLAFPAMSFSYCHVWAVKIDRGAFCCLSCREFCWSPQAPFVWKKGFMYPSIGDSPFRMYLVPQAINTNAFAILYLQLFMKLLLHCYS